MAGAGLFYLLDLKNRFAGKIWKRLGISAAALAVLFGAVFAVNRWDWHMYQTTEWQEYQEFNELRSQLLDYGFPDYDSNRDLYEELGISRAVYSRALTIVRMKVKKSLYA